MDIALYMYRFMNRYTVQLYTTSTGELCRPITGRILGIAIKRTHRLIAAC